ncbi:hypothetical protein [Vineibacter terrae]|uniref:hypothetical protein n=1 Tax=Vineibacter terrae TaxID=2586908 RepID=UPI0015B58ACA|nr:hypothetical protein [Vineibacter terrae]
MGGVAARGMRVSAPRVDAAAARQPLSSQRAASLTTAPDSAIVPNACRAVRTTRSWSARSNGLRHGAGRLQSRLDLLQDVRVGLTRFS